MTEGKKVAAAIGVVGLVAGGLLLATRKAAAAPPAAEQLPPGFDGPLTPEEEAAIRDGRSSNELTPEEEAEARETLIAVLNSPLLEFGEGLKPYTGEIKQRITVRGINWRASAHNWIFRIYDPTKYTSAPAPGDEDLARGQSWIQQPTWIGLDESATLELPSSAALTHVWILLNFADISTSVAMSGVIVVEDGMTIIYDDLTKSFSAIYA